MTYWKQEGTIKLVRQFGWVTHLIEKAVCPFHGEPGQAQFGPAIEPTFGPYLAQNEK